MALADACARGAFAPLVGLDLSWNAIKDAGIGALASACTKPGCLRELMSLALESNGVGDGGVVALLAACTQNGALPALKHLGLAGKANGIGADGMQALVDAVNGGAMPALEELSVHKEPRFGMFAATAPLRVACAARGIKYY